MTEAWPHVAGSPWPGWPIHARRQRVDTRALALLILIIGAAPLEGQGLEATRSNGYRLELGAAASTPLVEDGNGVAVRRGVAAVGGGDAAWTPNARTAFVASLRGSVAALHLRSMERRWSGGWTQQLDVALRVEHAVTASTGLGFGLAVAVLHGPDDVIPFREGGGMLYGWGPELTVTRRISRDRDLHALVGGDVLRITPRDRDVRVVGGWIGRLRGGVRYAL